MRTSSQVMTTRTAVTESQRLIWRKGSPLPVVHRQLTPMSNRAKGDKENKLRDADRMIKEAIWLSGRIRKTEQVTNLFRSFLLYALLQILYA